ncbi:MAG: hypothetical protein N3A00_01675 [Thermodesulfovibrio sp.]|nr:hypothetical protein [Thermodesulfovibrio sp.]
MKKKIHFQCITECSSICCGGATIITLAEIGKLYKFFPITAGFRKVYPFNAIHENYIQDITFKYKNFYIIGDFIAGNRLRKKCRFLKNSLCLIHGELKPFQCKVIPFSVTFPEEYQDIVIREKRKAAFRDCKGFQENFPIIWNGEFTGSELKSNFYKLKKELSAQIDLMEKIFADIDKSPFFYQFILSKDGLLEIPLINKFIEEICFRASIENPEDFIKRQRAMFITELTTEGYKNSLFTEALNVLDNIRI